MEKIRWKIKLVEWDESARLGLVSEPENHSGIYSNGILCPLVVGSSGEACNGDLWDLPLEITQHEGPSRRAVECERCGWWGSRAISIKGNSSGVKKRIKFSEWNRLRTEYFQLLVDKYDERITIVCDDCSKPLEDTIHRDFTGPIVKVQVLCLTPNCKFGVKYRLE